MHDKDKFLTMTQAAKIANVSPQAIFMAIKKGRLRATKGRHFVISIEDLTEYRANKYSRSKRTFEGERIHDLDDDKWSVVYAAKTLSSMLPKPVTENQLYYLIHCGRLPARKFAGAWILRKDDIEALYRTLKTREESEI